jgi:hypothetical protein
MHFKSIIAVVALTATTAVFAAPTPDKKPDECEWGYDYGKKDCYPKPDCPNGWSTKDKKCYDKPCEYGYDSSVSSIGSCTHYSSIFFKRSGR